MDDVVIIGGGICGLTLALALHQRGIACRVYERAPTISELGVGITLLPHGMREFAALGLRDSLVAAGIENSQSCFFNRFGQLIYREPRGKAAGYTEPEVGIHRGRLQMILYRAAVVRLGEDRIVTNRQCTSIDQDDRGVSVQLMETSTGHAIDPTRGRIVVGCDGFHSTLRKSFYPDDAIAFAGINTWRGITRMPPILDGKSYLRIGSILTGKMVIYPIVENIDGEGRQLVNWLCEIQQDVSEKNDWNKPGRLDDFYPRYADWTFDWLDAAAMIRNADAILEYPMVDKDPLGRWTFGAVTLAGDAAHPMYPRGSNGSAQAVVDARTLADCLASHSDWRQALVEYERARLPVTTKVVRTNREFPPDFINIRVEELVGDRPFDNLDDYITQRELRALSDEYKRIAGFAPPNT
ncbi:MAG TPA: flavin-dependent oxidoreductase [Casimicrobiaceae bacterium]|nr:flavin-dependent oxidoreductase [Casimicrobiaceae bacterium]